MPRAFMFTKEEIISAAVKLTREMLRDSLVALFGLGFPQRFSCSRWKNDSSPSLRRFSA